MLMIMFVVGFVAAVLINFLDGCFWLKPERPKRMSDRSLGSHGFAIVVNRRLGLS
jgi:hypothetical protein